MITVLDYGAGNIGSVLNMIKKVGGQAVAKSDINSVATADKLLLPGVGSFDNAMIRLKNLGLVEPIKEFAKSGKPLMGICLGMHLLTNSSEEGVEPGLGLIAAKVRKFKFSAESSNLRIPHMGWNIAYPSQAHPMMEGLTDRARFYFVHSYHAVLDNPEEELMYSNYGYRFTSALCKNNVIGFQFHPEKSHRYGMQLIKNFVSL